MRKAALGVVSFLLLVSSQVAVARVKTPGIKNHRESTLTVLSGDGTLPLTSNEPIDVGFSAFKKDFVLHLVRSPIIDEKDTKTYVVDDEGWHEIPTVNRSFMGSVDGDPDSVVRVSIVNGSLKGTIITGGTVYGVRSRADFDSNDTSGAVVVYRLQDNPLSDSPDDSLLDASSAEIETNFQAAAQRFVPDGVEVNPDTSANILLTNNGQLKRLSIGVIGDYAFVHDAHAGDTTAALDDINSAVNWVDYITRGGSARANGSVPVALRIGQRVVYATESAQVDDGISRCPLSCRTRKYCSTGSNIGASCSTNANCGAGGTCSGSESNSPGNRCSSNSDCTGTGVYCDQIPNNQKTCVGGGSSVDGRYCAGNADCGAGTCTSSSSTNVTICRGGPDDGKICQQTRCSIIGGCCGSPGVCVDPVLRAGASAGLYRTTKHCSGGSTAGYSCTTNSDCTGGTCVPGLITSKNSGKVQLLSGCKLYEGFTSGRICGNTGQGSWSVVSMPGGTTAFSDVDDFAHENGHSIGADHDGGNQTGVTCINNNLVITRNVCASGASVDKMCLSNSDCGGASCSKDNTRYCVNDGTKVCIDDVDCPGSTCVGPKNRLCVGGAKAGQICNADYADMCANYGGTCNGAPMNWRVYAMSGSGLLGGYSPCSQMDILSTTNVPDQSCLTPLQCGDVNKSGGSYCTGGSAPSSACAVNADCAGGGICTKVCSGGTTPGIACSSNSDCESSGTCTYVKPVTIADAQLASLIASGSWYGGILYDDLADVATTSSGGGPDGSVTNADSTYLLNVAVGTPGYPLPTSCGQVDTW